MSKKWRNTHMKTTIEAELKKIQTMKSKLEVEIEDIKRQRGLMGEQITLRNNQILKLDNEIKKLKSKNDGLIVSEHAILRYLERVVGIDLEQIKSKIISEKTQTMIETLGNGTYPSEGFKIKVVDNVVVTVIGTDEDSKCAA
jgi:hypothetical protein